MTTQTTSSAVGNWYAGVTLPGEGIFDILVRATDQIGNVGPAAASVVIIDASPPTVTVSARREGYTSIVVEWQGADTGSGVRSYDVQYAVDTPDNWQDWLFDTPQTQTSFGGEFGHSYYFRVQARDRAGNESSWVEVGPLSVELGEVKKYYSFGGQRVAMREGDDVYYLSGDHLGSVSLTTDAGGAVVAQARYLPYGEERWVSGTSPTDFGFTRQRSEVSFGLMDYNARMYSPVLGRFVSPDTIVPEPSSSSGFNRYAYVRNNPLKYTDPSGHYTCEDERGNCQPHRSPKLRAYYLNSVEQPPGVYGPNPNPKDEQGYYMFKMGEAAGPQNVKHIPIYVKGTYNIPLPSWSPVSGDNTRWQMFGEMFEFRTWSPVVADAITQDFSKDYVPGDRLVMVGGSGGGTIAIESLDLLAENGIFVDQVILRGSPVNEWYLSNVGRVDYIAANPPYKDKYYSLDVNPLDNVTVQEHRVGSLHSHVPQSPETVEEIGNLIADLMIP